MITEKQFERAKWLEWRLKEAKSQIEYLKKSEGQTIHEVTIGVSHYINLRQEDCCQIDKRGDELLDYLGIRNEVRDFLVQRLEEKQKALKAEYDQIIKNDD